MDYYPNLGEYKEGLGIKWEQVTDILGHEHSGTPDDDEKLVDWIVEHSEYSRDWIGEGFLDEDGWYVFIN